MARHPQKSDFPVSQVRRYLEPGPIVLVSTQWQGKTNIMTLGWHTVLEFSPSLVGCMISGGNHSFDLIRNSRECVINLPTITLTDTVVAIENISGRKRWPTRSSHPLRCLPQPALRNLQRTRREGVANEPDGH